MANEFNLSYTAEEIDRRLGEVDKIAELQEQIDELAQNQGTGGNTGGGGSGSTGTGTIEHPFSEKGFVDLECNVYYYEGDPSCNTGLVSLSNVHTIEYKVNLSNVGYELAFYNKNKELLSEISVLGDASSTTKTIDVTENKYADAAYACASHYGTNKTPSFKTIGYYESSGDSTIEGDYSSFVSKGTKGKTMLIFGDSITETDYMDDDCSNYIENGWQNWPTFAKDILQVEKIWNIAKSGAAYRDRDGVEARQKISHQISSAIASGKPADIIVISAGTNDGGSSIGEYETAMSKTSLEDLDRTNLYEAIRWAMWTLKTHYPDAVCFAATPIHRADHEPIPKLTEAITKMANRYNFIVIPAETESGIIRDNEVWQAAGHDLIDGLHPNENGQKKMARLYCNYILTHCIEK